MSIAHLQLQQGATRASIAAACSKLLDPSRGLNDKKRAVSQLNRFVVAESRFRRQVVARRKAGKRR